MLRDALVVGISSYQYLPALNAPAQDAEAIAHQLESNGDFRVTRLPEIVQAEKLRVGVKTPVTLAELESALVKLFKPKGSNIPHTALFYFSGHGLQKEAGISEGYLATSDANPRAHFYGLSLFWLRRLLQESPVRQRIVLLDCCHSGEILNYLEADPGAKSGTDRLFMAASREYESAYESLTGQFSVFTQALLEGLDPRRLPTGIVTNYALTDWVSNALKGESQQPLFENSGSEIVLTRCQNSLTVLQSAITQEICPYRGLEPFDEIHAEYFFGREGLTDQLVDKLRTGNFVAVVGASGSGKSSLVKAGLTYKLRRGQALSGSDRWQIRAITPTDHPFKSLATAFVNTEASAIERAEQLRRAELFLQEGATGLTQLVRASLMSEKRSTRLLLIIDQFEEIFTLCQGNHAERDRHRFFHTLITTLRNLNDQFSLVIVLRADFFSKCSFYGELATQIEHQLVMITPLNYDQIKASILKPAEKVGLVCDPNLVYNILLDIVGAPGELPLLQYTLLELWQRRETAVEGGAARLTLDAYTELGGVRGTLQKRANEIFYSLTPEEQRIAKRIFIALTQLGEGTEDTRRRVLKSELVQSQSSTDLVERVLEKLVIAKLVVTNQMPSTCGYQEQVDQRFANVSTALRLAQVVKNKTAQSSQSTAIQQSLPNIQATLNQKYNLSVTRLSQVSELSEMPAVGNGCQETVDIAHEALIRNWGLLRSWLDENREMLRRQRRIERAAREWSLSHEARSQEYLLRGSRLLDAEDFLNSYAEELSMLAHRYIAASREANRRIRRELRLLQVSVPCTLMVALGITFSQYRMAVKNQVEKDYQLQVATSRQWSAIAQSLLQEPDHDPTTALLISRLAAEQGRTYEAETSLRAALQEQRLQAHWQVGQKPVQQIVFSPNYDWLATIDTEGRLVLSSLKDQQVQRVLQEPETGETDQLPQVTNSTIAFSRDGKLLVAHAASAPLQVWSVEQGRLQHELAGFSGKVSHVAVHTETNLVAASSGNAIKVWNLATGELQTQGTQRAEVKQLQFNADGTRLLVADAQSIALIQIKGWKLQKRLHPEIAIAAANLSPDERWLAVTNVQGMTQIWDAQTGKRKQTLQPLARSTQARMSPINLASPQVVFSPNGEYFAIVNSIGQVQVVQVRTQQQWSTAQTIQTTTDNTQHSVAIAFSPNSHQIGITGQRSFGTDQNVASLKDATTGQDMVTLQGQPQPLSALQFSQDGSLIATASTNGSVQLWSTESGGELSSLKLTSDPIQWAHFHTFSAAESELASSVAPESLPITFSEKILAIGRDGLFRQWRMTKPHPTSAAATSPRQPHQPREQQTYSQTSSYGSQLFRYLEQISKWTGTSNDSANTQPEAYAPRSPISPAHETETMPQPTATLITTSVPEGNLIRQMKLKGRVVGTGASQDGRLIAIATSAGLVEVWQMQANQPSKRLVRLQESSVPATSPSATPAIPVPIHYLAFSPDSQQLLGVGVDKTIRLWKLDSGELQHQLTGHEALIEQAHFSPDGRKIMSASWDRTARIWDAESGQLLQTLTQQDVVTSAHFSPNSQRVLLTSLDSTARVVDVATGALQVILAGHRGGVLDGNFSPDGKLIVTASTDGSARLWDAHTGVERAILRVNQSGKAPDVFKRAFFSPNGQHVATLSSNGALHLWVATWTGLLDVARARSLRQLNPDECLRYLRLAPNTCPRSN
ncbi:MAG: caspase family protein [Leptolyngbyaceae cyanobacterium bins.302]|nr:caspase family protein [Leptolyngbyaceae cyanobacterium bins.302]